jgi:3-hydroxyisobutyrate dehydrogenase-like beta-hydroxyacid dehydrogenase
LVVRNRSPTKTAEAVAHGARAAGSVEEAVRQVEVVLSSLANDDAVRTVAAEVHRSLGDAIYAEGSTISPGLAAQLAGQFERFVSMPVAGNPDVVRQGKGIFLVGGSKVVVDELAPMLSSLSEKQFNYPEAAQAATAKLTVNLLLLDGVVALAESVTVGRAGGLSTEQLRQLLTESPVVAPGLKNRIEAILTGEGATWWTTVLGAKDVRLAGELAASAGKDLPVTGAVRQRYEEAADHGMEDRDIAAVADLYRD